MISITNQKHPFHLQFGEQEPSCHLCVCMLSKWWEKNHSNPLYCNENGEICHSPHRKKKYDYLIFKWCIKCRLCKAVSLVRTWRNFLHIENNFGVLSHKTNQNVGVIYLCMSKEYTSEKGKIDMFSEGLFPHQ